MKNLTLTGTLIAASMLLTACDPQPARKKPAPTAPTQTAPTEKPAPTEPKKVEKKKPVDVAIEDPQPVVEKKTPESKPVPPPAANPEYGKKSDGKPGFIESPYAPGKLIDVRGLPPGTEIECPYTRRALLVP